MFSKTSKKRYHLEPKDARRASKKAGFIINSTNQARKKSRGSPKLILINIVRRINHSS